MKHTIKLDAMKSIKIQPHDGRLVLITLTTFGLTAIEQLLTTDQAALIAQALDIAIGEIDEASTPQVSP